MANKNLVKKKPVALDVATYERLSKLAAQLRIDNPGGGFVSMSTAVGVLLDRFTNVTQSNIEAFALKLATGIVDTQINTAKKVKEGLVNPDHIDPELLADDWAMWIELQFEEFNKPKTE